MKCPVDDAPLRELERGGFKLASCSQCTGLWITRDTLKQAFASHHRPEKLDEAECQPPMLKPGPARQRLCPCCHYQLADFFSVVGNGLGELASTGVDVAKPVVEFLGEALSLLDW